MKKPMSQMNDDKFFPLRPESKPTIYAYEDTNPQYNGLLKVGYTTVDAQNRVAQQYPTKRPGNWQFISRNGMSFEEADRTKLNSPRRTQSAQRKRQFF